MMANAKESRKRAGGAGLYALVCLLLVGSLLALSLVVAKLADGVGAPRLTFLMTAMAGAAVVLGISGRLRGQPMIFNRRTFEYTVVAGVLFAVPNALAFLAVRHVGAAFISMSFALPILITWLLAVGLRLERLSVMRLSGVLLGLTGGLVLAAAKAGGTGGELGWVLLVLAMPLVLAFGNVYRTLRWPAGASPVFLAALMMLGGAATLPPFVLLFELGQIPALFTTEALELLLLETAVFSVLYLLYFVLQELAGPVYLSQIGTVGALVGTLIAIFGLGEAPPPNLGWAGLLVLAGTVLFHRGARAATITGGGAETQGFRP